jgi:hypothetical protein
VRTGWRALLDAEDRALLATAGILLVLGAGIVLLLAGVLGLAVRLFVFAAWGA